MLDNETRLVPGESTLTDVQSEENEKKTTKINLKPIMKYAIENNKLNDIFEQDNNLETNPKTGYI